MIALWLQSFKDEISVLNLFRYITVRSALAAATAFFISLCLGPWLIRKLKQWGLGEVTEKGDSDHLDDLHAQKNHTPTFGGLLFLIAAVASVLCWARPDVSWVWATLLVMISSALVGFWDDFKKLKGHKGLNAAVKLFLLCLIAGLAGSWLMSYQPTANSFLLYGDLHFPFFKNQTLELGFFYPLLAIFVFVGTANAVNLTDGLDGLAIGAYVPLIVTFSVMSYFSGHYNLSEYLIIPYIPQAGELAVFCCALAGAGLGFLWFNCHPAEIFMGDTGSLALGGTLGFISLVIHQELILLLAGGVFVVETLSVILQVGSFRWKGKRIFRCAPLHHHYQFKGLHENKITVRFWILGIILAVLSLLTLKVR